MKELELVEEAFVEDVVCTDVTEEELPEMISLGERMIQFCNDNGGAGLAAPQVGVNKKMFVWYIGEERFQIVFNPSYCGGSAKTSTIEGCLSYHGLHFFVRRDKEIQATCLGSKDGKFYKQTYSLSGEKAILFAHECDHVNYQNTGLGKTVKQLGEILEDEGWK